MPPFISNGRLPGIKAFTTNDVSPEERTSAIDFVNRHNFVFEKFDHATMISTFLPDGVVYHNHGTVCGHVEMKKFLENTYGFLHPGIGRNATNHVVDRDEDGGLVIRYQECLVRYGWEGDELDTVAGTEVTRKDGLPSIWWFGTLIDRLRMTSDGWKIHERYMGTSYRNQNLDPVSK
jgi:hypothetical protein